MSTDIQQLLKKQLEQQAQLFATSQKGTELVLSILATCSVLLRVAENEIPKVISQSEFDSIFAGYLGVSNRINNFYKKKSSYFDLDESEKMRLILSAVKEAEDRKREFDVRIVSAEKQNLQTENEIQSLELQLNKEENKNHLLAQEEDRLKKQLEKVKDNIERLNGELISINGEIENLEPEIERIIQETAVARETYEEMTAYYSELQRIRDGIKEEGFVDMASFDDKIRSMNDLGAGLMKEYDSLLMNLTADVETLQSKIEERRKPGIK